MEDTSYMLFNYSADCTADANGTAFDVQWEWHNPVVFQLFVPSASGTTPTLDVKIQGSDDKSAWTDIKSFEQMTAAGIQAIRILTPYKYIRGVIGVGGTTPNFGLLRLSLIPAFRHNVPR